MNYNVNDVIKLNSSGIKLGLIISVNSSNNQLSVFNVDNDNIDILSSGSDYIKVTNTAAERFIKQRYKKYLFRKKVDEYMSTHKIDGDVYKKSISEIFNCTELNSAEITRIHNCLEVNLKINTFLDLLCYTPFDLKKIRNIGKKTYNDIVSVVLKYCELTGIEAIFTEEEYMSVL